MTEDDRMASIDKFIAIVFKHNAERLIMDADDKAALVAGGQLRHVTSQPITQAQLQELIQEILPDDVTRIATTARGREFGYQSPHGSVRVLVSRQAHGPRVEVEPLAAPAAVPAPPDLAFGEGRVGIAVQTEPLHAPAGATAAAPAVSAAAATGDAAAPGVQARPRIETLFEKMVLQKCSDLHLSVGTPPLFRKDGEMTRLGADATPLSADDIRGLLLEITPGPNCVEFDDKRDTDFSYEMNEQARFRANLFMDRRGMGAVFRFIPARIPTPQELGFSKHILDLCHLNKGLVLVTGPTGSGKSTTLAAMIDHINATRSAHIITVEDPIEFVHPNRKCLVNQREIGLHTEGFKQALRAALREDPDIVLVGEMRDLETVAMAIETAETGHLVFGTLHTNTAASAVDRMIDQFPADRQAQVRTMLAESLRGVIAQTLLRRRTGGLVAALEVLLVNSAVSNLIREGKTFQIQTIIQTGKAAGMVTMNDALLDLVRTGLVEPEVALSKATNRTEFRATLERAGVRVPAHENASA
jgi:twitching motility protein PilT